MRDTIKSIWERNNAVWLATRQDIKATLGIKISQQEVYDIVNDITDADRIAPCGKIKIFARWDRGYQFCAKDCECATAHNIIAREQTCIERYGVSNPMQDADVQKSFKQGMIAAHGVEHALQSETLYAKSKSTLMANHGVDTALASPEILAKSRATCMDKFGVDNGRKAEVVSEKIRNTVMEKYQVDSILKSPEIRQKIKSTSRVKYGRDHHTQEHISQETMIMLEDKQRLDEMTVNRSLAGVAHELGIYPRTLLKYRDRHGLPKIISQSSYEKEISTFLTNLGVEHKINVRTMIGKQELDFYIPSHNLAIEFNGLYWHSSLRVKNDYHRLKYEACRDRGIRLIMINEDEWILRRRAWESRLVNILNKSRKGLPARKLRITSIAQNKMNAFCEQNHIQGKTRAAEYTIGAFSDNDMVGIMAFGRQRNSEVVELTRFCTDGDSHAGLFSRLFRHAVRECCYDHVVSFADLRHSNGVVYSRNGFTLVDEIRSDYRYVFRDTSYHKSSFTKKKIAERFPEMDMSILTEKKAMEILGIPRIYDCGKLKFEWTRL